MNEFENDIQAKIDADDEFKSTLTGTEDENKVLIEARRKELIDIGIQELREKAEKGSKAEQIAEDQRKRAEKAEADVKKYKPAEKKSENDDRLSTKDFYALNDAKVPLEDVDDVTDYAKFKGITVAEALRSSVVKATLNEKAEVRRTANASQTRQTRSQNVEVDGNTIADDIKSKGEVAVPEPGSKAAEALFWARRGRKPQ